MLLVILILYNLQQIVDATFIKCYLFWCYHYQKVSCIHQSTYSLDFKDFYEESGEQGMTGLGAVISESRGPCGGEGINV